MFSYYYYSIFLILFIVATVVVCLFLFLHLVVRVKSIQFNPNVEEQSNVEDEDGANLELRNDADQQTRTMFTVCGHQMKNNS